VISQPGLAISPPTMNDTARKNKSNPQRPNGPTMIAAASAQAPATIRRARPKGMGLSGVTCLHSTAAGVFRGIGRRRSDARAALQYYISISPARLVKKTLNLMRFPDVTARTSPISRMARKLDLIESRLLARLVGRSRLSIIMRVHARSPRSVPVSSDRPCRMDE
jgi:hypothetical protein